MKFRIVLCLLSLLSLAVLSWPTLAHATYSGKNGRIAFILGPDVYTMNPDGSDVRHLTHVPADRAASWEFWSPDGKQIVFNEGPAAVGGVGEIWLMNADGSNQQLIFKEEDFSDDRPSFTPDGKFVIFNRCNREVEECAIYRIGVDGSGLTALTKYELGILDLSASASPDGQSLLFTGISHDGIIAALYLKGSNTPLQRLTPVPLSPRQPNWSPDGETIAFSTHCCNPQNEEIWVVGPDGSGLRQLTSNGNDYFAGPHDFHPSWSPRGDAIVFERDAPDKSSSAIFVMKPDGTGLTKAITLPHTRRDIGARKSSIVLGAQGQIQVKQIEEGGALPRWGASSE